MHRTRTSWPALVALLVWAAAGSGPVGAAAPTVAEPRQLERAIATQEATRARLRVLGDAFSCTEARFVSYRRSSAEPELVDHWYVASQLWADARLLLAASSQSIPARLLQPPVVPSRPRTPAGWNESEARCHLDKGFIFLDRLWDYTVGGYYPLSDPTGTAVDRGPRHADDNSLAGLALLAAADSVADGAARRRYLHAARREADFLTRNGLWDETFGGGFWWNTDKGDTLEGKPTQTNALAALFFARLHNATGLAADRDWALRALLWLDTILYDPSRRLYRWSAHYQDPENRAGPPVISDRYVNYDQGIAIEAQILASGLDGDPGRRVRARAVGEAVPVAFGSRGRDGYNLEVGIEQVYTAFAAWTSLGHLALYDLDGEARWLELARANADALATTLGEPDGGYAYRHYRCVDRRAFGCESGEARRVVDRRRDTAAQAWMQHLQTAIALRPATPRPAAAR
jgi:Glycosyl hydrolase family 76